MKTILQRLETINEELKMLDKNSLIVVNDILDEYLDEIMRREVELEEELEKNFIESRMRGELEIGNGR